MRYLPNSTQMKSADAYSIHEKGIPSMVLMERAARSCVDVILARGFALSNVCVVCGSGNNGGDGFAIARMLREQGANVRVAFIGNPDKCTEETRQQWKMYEACGGLCCKDFEVGEYSIIIDAVFGVGLSREITGNYAQVLENMNASCGVKLAVDIPSGVSADTGQVLGIAFDADLTVTFQAQKLGMSIYPGKELVGRVVIADIGISEDRFEKDCAVVAVRDREDYRKLLPLRKENSHKGSYGKVLIIAGSKGMSGAAFLNGMAAYATGAGLVQIYTPEANREILQILLPEAIIRTYENYDEQQLLELLTWADVVCIGSGLGTGDISKKIVETTVPQVEVPCVIDADALNLLAQHMEVLDKKKHGNVVLTPHMKEMSRLTGKGIKELVQHRAGIAKEFAEHYEVTCVLKDANTLVSSYDARSYLNPSGNAAMAKAGSGDVLTGIIGGLLAQGISAKDAGALGAYLHGCAGDLARETKGSYSVLARDLIDQLSGVFKELEETSRYKKIVVEGYTGNDVK